MPTSQRVSAIVATRNRPALLRRALQSVAAQTHPDLEIVLVDDGSDDPSATTQASDIGRRVELQLLPPIPGGHGPGFARNHGAAHATGDLLAFLDDDDEWIDADYLARSVAIWTSTPGIDLLYANQKAVRSDGTEPGGTIWIEDLAGIIARTTPARADGTFLATPWALLQSHGFGHLNATVVRRAFFQELGGFDVLLRYEEDRDFHLRAIDAAQVIVHSPAFVARHHIPEQGSASTSLGPDRRALDQLRVLDKAILGARRPEIRAYARRYKAYTLKTLAQRRAEAGDTEAATFYAREALAIAPNPKWAAYTAWLHLRRRR